MNPKEKEQMGRAIAILARMVADVKAKVDLVSIHALGPQKSEEVELEFHKSIKTPEHIQATINFMSPVLAAWWGGEGEVPEKMFDA